MHITVIHFAYPTGTTSLGENGVASLTIGQNPYIDGTLSVAIPPNGFIPSITYTIKIIGKDNTQLSFNVKG